MTELAVLLFALLLSAFSSGSETAFSAASRIRAYSRVREGRKWARLALGFVDDPTRFLNTTLVSNNVGNVLASVIASRVAAAAGPGWLEPASVAALSLLLLVFCEMLPKHYMLLHGERLVTRLSVPLAVLRVLLYPLILVADAVSSLITGGRRVSRLFESKSEIMGLLSGSSTLRGRLAGRVLGMDAMRAGSIMRDLDDVPTVSEGCPTDSALARSLESGSSYLLVTERDGRTVRGIVKVAAVAGRSEVIDSRFIEGLPSVRAEDDLMSVIAGLRRTRAPAGIVLGSTGQPEGLLTLDDIADSLIDGGPSPSQPGEAGRIRWTGEGAELA